MNILKIATKPFMSNSIPSTRGPTFIYKRHSEYITDWIEIRITVTFDVFIFFGFVAFFFCLKILFIFEIFWSIIFLAVWGSEILKSLVLSVSVFYVY